MTTSSGPATTGWSTSNTTPPEPATRAPRLSATALPLGEELSHRSRHSHGRLRRSRWSEAVSVLGTHRRCALIDHGLSAERRAPDIEAAARVVTRQLEFTG